MGSSRLLSQQQRAEYASMWDTFKHKNELEHPYHVHSSRPVISKVMLYEGYDHPILRAKVHQKKLQEFDPYFTCRRYTNPFWHLEHYIMVAEQMYHAGSNMVRDNSELVVKDTIEEFRIARPIFWRNGSKHVSVELMLKRHEKEHPKYLFSEDVMFAFYNEKNRRELGGLQFKAYVNHRAYLQDIHTIEQSADEAQVREATNGLIRKIRAQTVRHNLALQPRAGLADPSVLIRDIRKGAIPHADIKNYFSLWQSA